jgi:hypothetical protein
MESRSTHYVLYPDLVLSQQFGQLYFRSTLIKNPRLFRGWGLVLELDFVLFTRPLKYPSYFHTQRYHSRLTADASVLKWLTV